MTSWWGKGDARDPGEGTDGGQKTITIRQNKYHKNKINLNVG